jgi:hypothetical protein
MFLAPREKARAGWSPRRKPLEDGSERYGAAGRWHQWLAVSFKPYADGRFDVKENRLNASEKRTLAENLRRHVPRLSVDIGERHLWSGDSLERAASYIESEFSAAGYAPTRQAYTAYRRPVANIIAEKKGTRPQSIVIGAHYDSVPGSPGADDNASGVAGLLELARMLRTTSCTCGFKLVAFVNEESPSFGSDYMGNMQYARRLRQRVK